MKEYSLLSDEELVKEYKETRDEGLLAVILERFSNLIARSAAPLFLYGADKEDLMQEGRMGLYEALGKYDPEINDSFIPFAKTCISRAQLKAVTAANRKKHGPLNNSLSLDADEDEGGVMQNELLTPNPEDILMDEYSTGELLSKIEKILSSNEMEVLLLHLEGYTYKQIAIMLNKEAKSVDNALQRVKSKVSNLVNSVN